MRIISTLFTTLVAAALPGCIYYAEPPADEPPIVDSGDYVQFVQTGWSLPTTSRLANELGMDLDGDGYNDNVIGAVIGALNGIGLEVTLANEEAFGSGDLVLLHSLRADSLADDATVSWQLLLGSPSEPPRFDGTDELTAVGDLGTLIGMNRGGVVTTEFGAAGLYIPLFPDQPALGLPLDVAYLEVELGNAGAVGRIAGGIDARVVRDDLLPRLAEQVITHMASHPDHPFTTGAIQIFDADHDGQVSVDEIANASITKSLLSPDLDLDLDGEYDHVSFAVGLELVPATFAPLGR